MLRGPHLGPTVTSTTEFNEKRCRSLLCIGRPTQSCYGKPSVSGSPVRLQTHDSCELPARSCGSMCSCIEPPTPLTHDSIAVRVLHFRQYMWVGVWVVPVRVCFGAGSVAVPVRVCFGAGA